MKKKLFLRLCLMLLVGVSAFSCRTEEFHNEEEAHGNTGLLLTSKRISLSEAKHRTQLVPELQKAEIGIKAFAQKNAKSKINYANGVSIDTDQVTYIENGPNFHTYTFHLSRQNALPTDPVENLVLFPTTDGTYKELLVSYALSVTEKETLKNGGFVDTKGKMSITELASGTYNPLSKGMTACGWQEENTFVTVCSENQHGMWNTESWGSCSADRKPGWHTTMVYKCDFIYTGNETGGTGWWAGPGGGTDNGGGEPCPTCPTDPTQQPCNGNGVSTGLIDPNTNIGEGGCAGIPTVIEVPLFSSCGKIKGVTDNSFFKDNVTDLQSKTWENREWGYTLGNPVQGTSQTGVQNQLLESKFGSKSVKFTFHYSTFAFMHTHYKGIYPIFSPGDVIEFNNWLIWAKNWNANPANANKQIDLSKLSYTVVTDDGNYMMTFDGTDIVPFPNYTKQDIENLNVEYQKNLASSYTVGASGPIYNMDKLELEFMKFLRDKLNMTGLKLYKIESDANYELYLQNGSRKKVKCR
ncbi:hypothetical protein [Chryseobacterium binzhouense]|uniref:hypothetical protein n=1 Tax=Chryseobacterium binzhouense TaxID=2593646 RepID=UPI00117C87F5|nr:hypothetical protein [Chryseobacterium binzhouense]